MFVSLRNFKIAMISVVTGDREIHLDDEVDAYGGDVARLERLKKATGLSRRAVVSEGITAVDLAEKAVRRLERESNLDVGSVDACFFVTQTPDHFQPGNAAILHGRLKMKKSVACWDVNLGCSGWVYGLVQAGALIQSGVFRKVMLVAGDTLSRQVDPADRTTVPLFGDAASVTILEQDEGREFTAVLGTDGEGASAIRVPAGGFRVPFSEAGEFQDAEGNPRREEYLFMDGGEVFKFTLREVPAALDELLEKANLEKNQVDYYFFHQANAYILSNLRRRMKVEAEKVPDVTLGRYGNLSSASIPAVICETLRKDRENPSQGDSLKAVLCGFGVGLSWATALTDLQGIDCLDVVTFGND